MVMNMVGLLVWTSLVALAQGQFQSHRPLTLPKGQEVTDPASDGEGFSSDLSWVSQGIPSDDWMLSGWVFIATAADSAKLMQVTSAVGGEFYFYWPAAGQPTFNLGAVDHFDPAAPSTRSDKWFHVAMGSQGGKSHGVVTLKGNPTQFEIEWTGVVMMLGTTTFKGPVGDTTFTVRDM